MGDGRGHVVIDLSTDIAGAYCARMLGALGATVTKVEPVEGGPLRTQPPVAIVDGAPVATRHEYLDCYKRGIAIDDERDHSVLDALIAGAHLVLSSCDGDPGATAVLEARVRRLNPNAVHVVTSPYGLTGPYASYRSSELTRWAAGGFLQITGSPDDTPLQGGGPWVDYATGATAAVGALAALRVVADGGAGQLVDVGAMEVQAGFHQWSLVLYTHQGVIKKRAGNRHAESFHPLGPVPCRDGWVGIGIASVQQWEGFCIAIDMPELLIDDRFQSGGDRFDNADALDEMLAPKLMSMNADELVHLLQDAHVPAATVMTITDALEDRQLAARGFWADIDVGGRRGKVPDKAFRLPTADPPFTPAPALGEHSAAILAELGYGADEIAALVASGAVATGSGGTNGNEGSGR